MIGLVNVWDTQWIEFKEQRIGTYEINKMSLSCFDDNIYVQNNGFDRLALEY